MKNTYKVIDTKTENVIATFDTWEEAAAFGTEYYGICDGAFWGISTSANG